MILTGLIAFASSIYASLNFREIYHKIHIIFEEEDAFDERCDSKSYNDVNFCVCNIGPARNKTEKVLKFRGKHKQLLSLSEFLKSSNFQADKMTMMLFLTAYLACRMSCFTVLKHKQNRVSHVILFYKFLFP